MPPGDARRALPQVDRVVAELHADLPHPLLVECARRAVEAARARAGEGGGVDVDAVLDDARREAEALRRGLLRRVVNATGVLVHTNLGRTPLDAGSYAAAEEVATGYSNLEYAVDEGRRGSRHEHAGRLLARAVGAEAGLVVNNNAAAVLLVLAGLARGREVLVSRGELVEIGGGFRIPDVMEESGARLVEVGTTNRTRVADYEAAVTPETAAVLKVHASNYRMVGFVESAPVAELAGLGPPVVFDCGSGLLDERTPWLPTGSPPWLSGEPGVRQAMADGAAVVTFSGDKLLGGPQAGVVVGRSDLLDRVARHPLARAVRADKVTLAVMQAVALAYLEGRAGALPLWRMASEPVETLRARAKHLAAELEGVTRAIGTGGAGAGAGAASSRPGVEVVELDAVVGGGSLPGQTVPSAGLALHPRGGDASVSAGDGADRLARALRERGVIPRVEHDTVLLDLRTVDPSDDDLVLAALGAVAAPER